MVKEEAEGKTDIADEVGRKGSGINHLQAKSKAALSKAGGRGKKVKKMIESSSLERERKEKGKPTNCAYYTGKRISLKVPTGRVKGAGGVLNARGEGGERGVGGPFSLLTPGRKT